MALFENRVLVSGNADRIKTKTNSRDKTFEFSILGIFSASFCQRFELESWTKLIFNENGEEKNPNLELSFA